MNALQNAIVTNSSVVVNRLINEDPTIVNKPFNNGTLPLHLAVSLKHHHITQIFFEKLANPFQKDGAHLDAFQHACFVGTGELLLKKITKTHPVIQACTDLMTLKVVQQLQRIDAIEEYSIEGVIQRYLYNLDTGGLDRALSEQNHDILHFLLINKADPNEKEYCLEAAKRGDLTAVYFLLAYGAKLTPAIVEAIKAHDPLRIDSVDVGYFLSTAAYWGARALLPATSYIPMAIQLVGATWFLSQKLPGANRAVLMALQLLPSTNIALKVVKTSIVATSFFKGLYGAYNNAVYRPLQALAKGVVHTVGMAQSLYSLTGTIQAEFRASEELKALTRCSNVTADDLYDFEQVADKQSALLDDSDKAGCLPFIQIAFPEWTCDTFRKLFREASRTGHPDKGGSVQEALNAMKEAFKKRCDDDLYHFRL